MLPEGEESPSEFFSVRLGPAAAARGIELPSGSVAVLARFLARVDLWRRRTNLTGPFPPEELISHALESALGAGLLPRDARVVDIGSGAGFPGVPVAILRPDLTVIPVEPRRKRREFLDGIGGEIGIENLESSVASLSALPPDSLLGATARAVADLPGIVTSARALKTGSLLLVWTTRAEELAASLRNWFVFDGAREVPGSERKQIAIFRRNRLASKT